VGGWDKLDRLEELLKDLGRDAELNIWKLLKAFLPSENIELRKDFPYWCRKVLRWAVGRFCCSDSGDKRALSWEAQVTTPKLTHDNRPSL